VWSPQQYISKGRSNGVSEELLHDAVEQIEKVANGGYGLPSILTLNHLAKRTDIPYPFLRHIVDRADHDSYRKFSIKKRSGGRRFIHVPAPRLMLAQRWVNEHVLKKIPVHSCSFAFNPGSSIVKCASRHTGARWLIKMDITGFFESISEIQVCRVFKELGYQPLVAFELSRISTVSVGSLSPRRFDAAWKVKRRNAVIPEYSSEILGYLPQGAPTSPLLSNLVMREIDDRILSEAKKEDLTYTRYSDDLTFSTRRKKYSRSEARAFISSVGKILKSSGFKPQHRKTIIVPPGSRKIVLGLQVDGDVPKLRREFKDKLRQHIYFLEKFGPVEHAKARNFDTIWGMKCHIRGLIDYANMIDSAYAGVLLSRFNKLDWPV